jgi:hypothetical protein
LLSASTQAGVESVTEGVAAATPTASVAVAIWERDVKILPGEVALAR